jgi:hypothetical protein
MPSGACLGDRGCEAIAVTGVDCGSVEATVGDGDGTSAGGIASVVVDSERRAWMGSKKEGGSRVRGVRSSRTERRSERLILEMVVLILSTHEKVGCWCKFDFLLTLRCENREKCPLAIQKFGA